jgi:phosphate-selective porin
MHAARPASVGLCAALLFSVAARAADAPTAEAVSQIGDDADGVFLRSRDGAIVLFPGGRLQVDGAFFPRQTPKSGAYIRRARVELRGWLGPLFYFDVSSDFAPGPPADTDAAPSVFPAADDYLAFAPFGDQFIVQAGQFDAPFTLENRTSDAYTDFIERAMVARTFGAPRNKEVGIMAHGLVADGRFYYSGGVFNGEGPEFRNIDNQSETIGRLVVTPFAPSGRAWRGLSLGVSAWYGNHVLGPEAPVQATPGGMVFLEPHWTSGQPPAGRTFELHEQGTVTALGGELNLPIGDRFGVRGEVVWKKQHLVENDTTMSPGTPVGDAVLDGFSGYGEIWFWLWGDARQLPAPGYELPRRLAPTGQPGGDALAEGLQIAVRGELLQENLTSDNPTVGDPGIATTRVTSGTIGVNYWRGRLVRLSANYIVNQWGGTSLTIMSLVADGKIEQEFLLRFAMSM